MAGLPFGAFLFAISGTQTIDAGNPDFAILRPALLNVLLFSALFPLYGIAAVYLAHRIRRRQPRLGAGQRLILYTPALALAALFLIPTAAAFFSRGFCACIDPSVATGSFLAVVALATVWTWIRGFQGREDGPPAVVRAIAYAGLAGATMRHGHHPGDLSNPVTVPSTLPSACSLIRRTGSRRVTGALVEVARPLVGSRT